MCILSLSSVFWQIVRSSGGSCAFNGIIQLFKVVELIEDSNGHITTLIFDIGNVIVPFDYLRGVRRFSEVTGLSEEKIERFFYLSELQHRYAKGQISSEDFFETLRREFDLKIDYRAFVPIWNDIFWLSVPMDRMVRFLKGNYRLAAITNTSDLHFRYWLENYPVLGLFERIFASHELGLCKPDPEIYRLALDKLRVKPDETLFVDDMEENVAAARELGMRAVLFRTAEDLQDEFQKLKILTHEMRGQS